MERICPSPDCEAGAAHQRPVKAVELKQFDNPSWGFKAMVCQVCGCIYTPETDDMSIIRRRAKA
jgi:hypothetical protein